MTNSAWGWIVVGALVTLGVGCNPNMKGTWKGKCSIAGKEDSIEKKCSVEVSDTEMIVTVPGYLRCTGAGYKYSEGIALSTSKCTVADADGKATEGSQGCDKLTVGGGGLDLKKGDDQASLREVKVSAEKICLPGTDPKNPMGNAFSWFNLSAKSLKRAD